MILREVRERRDAEAHGARRDRATSAIDETSIATCVAPRLRITARTRASSSASGVVCEAAMVCPAYVCPIVPTIPHFGSPSAPSIAARTRCVVVVLPFVPVMPMTSSENAGCP